MAGKHVVVDGSNIATEGRTVPSLGQLDEAVRAFVGSHPHDKVTVVVDATFGHRIDKRDRKAFEEAVLAGELVTPPAGAIGRGDAFVLQIADMASATVLSNDSFQEFHGQFSWLFDEGRLIGGKPVPDVGWVFVPRSPVRGPTSRRATKEALKAEKSARTAKKRAGHKPKVGAVAKAAASESELAPTTAATDDGRGEPNGAGNRSGRGRRRRPSADQPVNEPMLFLEFVGAHPVGSGVDAEVDRFSSHGAYVVADGAQCYVPLRYLGDPAPNSARKVLSIGETREFVVVSFDTPRRGIDLALPDVADAALKAVAATETDDQTVSDRGPDDVSPTTTQQAAHAEEAPSVAPAKKTAKRSSTKKAARKTAARKSTAKKASAKRSGAKKTAAKKKAAKKKAPAKKKKKAAKKKAPARKKKAAKKKAAAKKR